MKILIRYKVDIRRQLTKNGNERLHFKIAVVIPNVLQTLRKRAETCLGKNTLQTTLNNQFILHINRRRPSPSATLTAIASEGLITAAFDLL